MAAPVEMRLLVLMGGLGEDGYGAWRVGCSRESALTRVLYSGWVELAVGTARRDRLLDAGALQPLGTLPIRAVGAVCREDQVWCCLARRSWESLYVCVRSRVCTRHGIQVEGRAVM